MYYRPMFTDFGVDSSSCFLLRVQTNRQTRLNALPHTGGYTAGVVSVLRLSAYIQRPGQYYVGRCAPGTAPIRHLIV